MFVSAIYVSRCWADGGADRINLGNSTYAYCALQVVHDGIGKFFMPYGSLHEPTDAELYSSALKGMVSSLGDPYSRFMTPKEVKEYQKSDYDYNLTGVGVHLRKVIKDGDTNIIMFPYPGSPAAKAGIKSGDTLLVIDNGLGKVKVSNLTLEKIGSELQGEKGRRITLTVSDAQNIMRQITVACDSFFAGSVSWEMAGGTAVIRIYSFREETTNYFLGAVLAVLKAGAERLIIDLRDNFGGYVNTTVKIASYWTGDQVVCVYKDKNGESLLKGGAMSPLESIKTAVLVNGNSASASEILSGALQSYKKAILVGQKTFGKGIAQQTFPLPDGSALCLTTAEWLTPQREVVQGKGLKPDVEIDLGKGESQIIKEVESLLQ